MNRPLIPIAFVGVVLLLLLPGTVAQAYEVGLRYYPIQNHELAEAIGRIDETYDAREKPLKEARREAGYDTPAHRKASAELDTLREERDREFLRKLESIKPEIEYVATLDVGETSQESTIANGKPLHIELKLGMKDGNKIPVEIHAEYDERTLYKGSALLIPLNAPYVVGKSSIKVQGKRQATMIFVEVRP